MRFGMREGANLVTIIVFVKINRRITGDPEVMTNDFLAVILYRKKYDLVGAVPDRAFISIFRDVLDTKPRHNGDGKINGFLRYTQNNVGSAHFLSGTILLLHR